MVGLDSESAATAHWHRSNRAGRGPGRPSRIKTVTLEPPTAANLSPAARIRATGKPSVTRGTVTVTVSLTVTDRESRSLSGRVTVCDHWHRGRGRRASGSL
jgi:hypothetical protein